MIGAGGGCGSVGGGGLGGMTGAGGGAGVGAVGETNGAARWNEERNGLRNAASRSASDLNPAAEPCKPAPRRFVFSNL